MFICHTVLYSVENMKKILVVALSLLFVINLTVSAGNSSMHICILNTSDSLKGNYMSESKSTPSLPTGPVISTDLIGRKLTEGTDNGYFSSDWKWTIEPGEISGLKILSQNQSDDYCSFTVSMFLKSHSSPTRYMATVQVDYSLINKRWQMTLVKSKGIRVIKTTRYLDCISTKIGDDGWGGVSCLKIKNNIDSSLLVGGVYRTNNSHEWHKFSLIIDGLTVKGVGGTFGGGSVVDYRIDFVELY